MAQELHLVTLLVHDYDEALAFYTKALGFRVIEDATLGGGKRWVVVSPPGPARTSLLLARATTPEQSASVGNQAGGRVFLFLQTNDFWRDYRSMKSKDITFREEPREESYGMVVVFEDLYGNKWDLVQRSDERPE